MKIKDVEDAQKSHKELDKQIRDIIYKHLDPIVKRIYKEIKKKQRRKLCQSQKQL